MVAIKKNMFKKVNNNRRETGRGEKEGGHRELDHKKKYIQPELTNGHFSRLMPHLVSQDDSFDDFTRKKIYWVNGREGGREREREKARQKQRRERN